MFSVRPGKASCNGGEQSITVFHAAKTNRDGPPQPLKCVAGG